MRFKDESCVFSTNFAVMRWGGYPMQAVDVLRGKKDLAYLLESRARAKGQEPESSNIILARRRCCGRAVACWRSEPENSVSAVA